MSTLMGCGLTVSSAPERLLFFQLANFFLVWNCQGAASKTFRRTLKQILNVHKPSLLCLIEPKVSGNQANSICLNLGFDEWIRVEAVGFFGGIWVLWKNVHNIEIISTHPQFTTLQIDDKATFPWSISLVYGSPDQHLRRKLWSDLTAPNPDLHTPWLLVGDFNSVTCREEVSNKEGFSHSRCADFNSWIAREGLIDLGFVGSIFTWMRGINDTNFKGAHLDQALGNVEWKLLFPNALVEHLPIIGSDHSPLHVNTQLRHT